MSKEQINIEIFKLASSALMDNNYNEEKKIKFTNDMIKLKNEISEIEDEKFTDPSPDTPKEELALIFARITKYIEKLTKCIYNDLPLIHLYNKKIMSDYYKNKLNKVKLIGDRIDKMLDVKAINQDSSCVDYTKKC